MPSLPESKGVEGEHGHLVEQILEVQKELEESNNLMVASEEKPSDKTEIVRKPPSFNDSRQRFEFYIFPTLPSFLSGMGIK